jgi:hypothetical protein
VLAGLIFFLIRKRKRNQEPDEIPHEKEKEAFSLPPPPPMKPSTPSTPPQLSVRPVTQFAPDLSGNGGFNSGAAVAAGGLGAGAALGATGAAVASRNLTGNSPPPTPPKSSSSAQNPFNDPVNPFSPAASLAEQASPPASSAGPTETATAATAVGAAVAGAAVAGAVGAAAVASQGSDKEQSSRPASQESGVGMPQNSSPNRVSADAESVSSEVLAAAAGGAVVGAAAGGAAAPGPNNVHRVQMDFNPSAEDELELRSGALVRMLHEYDDGWVSVKSDRR